ncbi:MAG: hypothetical protein NT077_04285 [Candidatus Taylorbacteria bacterium]|nr:hypothetical protein [Candidatus Taylorbacteria bacterium]
MRSSLPLFRLFPPPKFMLMPHVGLDISDDGVSCIAYSGFGGARHISLFGKMDFTPGLFTSGDVKDEKEFIAQLAEFGKKHKLTYVKVSMPEEKAYLFQTEVPSTEQKIIEQNIEFKLEENVPLAAPDAVFYFDLLPRAVTGGALRASVSVVPRTYIEHYMELVQSAGLIPVSFEVVPKAIARAIIPVGSDKTRLIIHIMNKKTGIYIVSGNVIHFTFTAGWGVKSGGDDKGLFMMTELQKEISRIRSYWFSHGNGMNIDEAILVGKDANLVESSLSKMDDGAGLMNIKMAEVWCNATNLDKYIPAISRADSLGYAVAAGLAFDTPRSI